MPHFAESFVLNAAFIGTISCGTSAKAGFTVLSGLTAYQGLLRCWRLGVFRNAEFSV